jgi:hypothetical protein
LLQADSSGRACCRRILCGIAWCWAAASFEVSKFIHARSLYGVSAAVRLAASATAATSFSRGRGRTSGACDIMSYRLTDGPLSTDRRTPPCRQRRIMDKSDAPTMQSYPSPNAVAADSAGPFYSSSSAQHQPALSHPDDLQLAELSRGLAPIMNAGPGASMPDGQGARGQGSVNHGYDQESEHAHLRASHAPMDPMGGQYAADDGSLAPRKRSKVSRACDECRRKKIRCDATGEEGNEQCSSCKRVGTRCQFSRVPMKRGPSKG